MHESIEIYQHTNTFQYLNLNFKMYSLHQTSQGKSPTPWLKNGYSTCTKKSKVVISYQHFFLNKIIGAQIYLLLFEPTVKDKIPSLFICYTS